ncbi:MAG TPA: LPS export ABC transporter permease LptG [Bacteroidota bacterium]|nr:LPS export ABC transporter permease LptG [Bacteroidota bacterium]
MKHLDRSIVRQFLSTTAFSLVAVLLVFIVIDVMEKLDDFIDRQATWGIIVKYYILFTPEIIKLIIPVAMLLGSLFVSARLATQNEITAMKSSGISLYRIMVPFVCVALIVSGVSVYFNGWVVPLANQKKFAIERDYLHKDVVTGSGANIYIQDSRTRILSIGYFDDSRNIASRVSIQDFSPLDPTVMTERVDAVSMAWDSASHGWILSGGTRRWFEGGQERLMQFLSQPAGTLHFDPADLRKKQEKPDEMDYYTLKQFIKNQRDAGQDPARWLVDFYSKISFPFASVIVVLFGVPFASQKRRGGVGVQLGISLLICFIYLIFMKVSEVFGYNGDIDPLLTAWSANIIFLLGAVFVMIRVQK